MGRALRGQVGPANLSAARFIVGAMLYAWLLRRTSPEHPPKQRLSTKDWSVLIGMGMSGVFIFPLLLYSALRYTTATNVALINGSGPLITMFLAAIFLRERLTWGLLIGGLTSLIGVGILIGNNGIPISHGNWNINQGDALALTAMVMWGIYSILGRIATRTLSSLQVSGLSTWFALPALVVAAAWEWRSNTPALSTTVILSAIYIGVFPTVVGFLSWNEGIRRIGPNQAMAFFNTLPIFGALWGYLLLGEALSANTFIGGSFIIIGGLIAAIFGKRAEVLLEA